MVVDRQIVGEPRQHGALGVGLERLLAPVAANQVARFVGLAVGPVGRRQGHGALGAGRVLAVEPGDDRLGRQGLGLDQLFGGDLAARGARPALEIGPRLVELGELQPLGRRISHGPEHDLAGDEVGEAGLQGLGAIDVARLGGVDGLAQRRLVLGGEAPGVAGSVVLCGFRRGRP